MQAIVVTVEPVDVEVASDELWALGVVAIEERADPAGGVELWTSLGDDSDPVVAALAGLRWPWRFEAVDESVSETWREHALPTWVTDDIVVRPEWIATGRHDPNPDVIEIAIEPGATFGLGDHPTTVSTMLAMRLVIESGARVLDVGCGSGVLAIAACRFGAAHVEAIDISEAAVPTTRHNAAINGVLDRITVSTTPLADVEGTYDVVAANILAPALIQLSADLRRVMAPDGVLVISGILADRHAHVLAALEPLRVVDQLDRDGWTAITLRR